ncbi:MAG: hypothetical protein ABIU07_15605, partial [Ramlibacter sp.]
MLVVPPGSQGTQLLLARAVGDEQIARAAARSRHYRRRRLFLTRLTSAMAHRADTALNTPYKDSPCQSRTRPSR